MQHNEAFLQLVNDCRPHVCEINGADLKAIINDGYTMTITKQSTDKTAVVLLDVREEVEWQRGHIAQAIHVARGVLERDIEKTISDKNTPLIVYCSGGYRSILAAFNLQKMGYKHVYSLHGGLSGWLSEGGQLEV